MSMVKVVFNRLFLILIMAPGAIFCANALQYPFSEKKDFLESNLDYCFMNGADRSDGFTQHGVLLMQVFMARHKRKHQQDTSVGSQTEKTMQDHTGQAIEWMEELFRCNEFPQERAALEAISVAAASLEPVALETVSVHVCNECIPPAYFTDQSAHKQHTSEHLYMINARRKNTVKCLKHGICLSKKKVKEHLLTAHSCAK